MPTAYQINSVAVSQYSWMPMAMAKTSNNVYWVLAVEASDDLSAYYSLDGGVTWTREVVDTDLDTNGTYAAIMTDSTGQVHILIVTKQTDVGDPPEPIVHYIRSSVGVWDGGTTIDSDSNSNPIMRFGACIDANDKIHVVYTFRTNVDGDWHYRTWTSGGGWSGDATFGSSTNQSGRGIALVVDSSDVVHMSHKEGGGIYYQQRTGAGWQAEETIEAGIDNVGTNEGLAVDSDGTVHAVYTVRQNSGEDREVRYNRRVSGTWQTRLEVTDESEKDVRTASFSVDEDGLVWIVYKEYGTNNLYRRTVDAGTLGTETLVLDDSFLGLSFVGALWHLYDANGVAPAELQPTILVFDDTNNDLWIVTVYTTFPTDAVARVSSIRHIYRPGFFRMQVGLGDIGLGIELAELGVRKELETPYNQTPDLLSEAGMERLLRRLAGRRPAPEFVTAQPEYRYPEPVLPGLDIPRLDVEVDTSSEGLISRVADRMFEPFKTVYQSFIRTLFRR